MWTVVYVAPNRAVADMMKELLEQEGFVVMLRPIGAPHMGAWACGNLVPDSEVEEALEIIAVRLGIRC